MGRTGRIGCTFVALAWLASGRAEAQCSGNSLWTWSTTGSAASAGGNNTGFEPVGGSHTYIAQNDTLYKFVNAPAGLPPLSNTPVWATSSATLCAILYATLATLLSAGCQQNMMLPPSTTPTPSPFSARLLLAESGDALESGNSSTHFNFGYLRDLWVRVQVKDAPRMTQLTLAFVNPEGQIFYHDSVPFSTDPDVHELAESANTNAGHPITVYTARLIDGAVLLERAIPILGTVFQRVPPDGVWGIQAAVEGVPGTLTTSMEVVAVR